MGFGVFNPPPKHGALPLPPAQLLRNVSPLQLKLWSFAMQTEGASAYSHVMERKYVSKKKWCLLHELCMRLKLLDISFAKTDPVKHPPVRWIKKFAHKLHLLLGIAAELYARHGVYFSCVPLIRLAGWWEQCREKPKAQGRQQCLEQHQNKIKKLHFGTSVTNYIEESCGPKPGGQGGAEWSHSIIMSHNEICMCQTARP